MGNCTSEDIDTKNQKNKKKPNPNFKPIPDQYETLEEVQAALHKAGLETSSLVIGIDYTKSNVKQGKDSFNGKCLHFLEEDNYNPYQRVIHVMGRTLSGYNDDDEKLLCYGFGDKSTRDADAFPMYKDVYTQTWASNVAELQSIYTSITPQIILSGPTNYAPLIYKAIKACKGNESTRFRSVYHILIIIADGLVVNEQETIDAIIEASEYPLSIILVGVGDGPFDQAEEFDDGLPARQFDNFQFVHFDQVIRDAKKNGQNLDIAFAVNALMEIPDQFLAIKKLGLIGKEYPRPSANNNLTHPSAPHL
mmetsp:Transcript_1097/g.1696  ORF Transcript_1097/g.1696 Transcript_1097/m.1696 type:complete len:307 (+) Transcript_1097:68-988(+)